MRNVNNYALIACLSLFVLFFSMISLQQGFSDDGIPALSISSEGNVGMGIVDSKYNLHVADNARFSSTGDIDFLSEFGSHGSENSQLIFPYGIAIHQNGDIYVADTGNNRIQIFDSTGAYISQFGSRGSGDSQFNAPRGIAISPNGDIYVADSGNHRINILNSTGAHISQFGSFGSGDSQFNIPRGIAIDQSGNIYVADTDNDRIKILNSTGALITKFGSPGSGNGMFSSPYGVTVHLNGDIYVVDTDNHRIQIFDSTGAYISQFGSHGSGDSQFKFPTKIAIDQSGNIYVADSTNDRIQIFDSTGAYISEFGSSGSGNSQFDFPTEIAIHQNGDIYVADADNNRIKIFSPVPTLLIDNGNVGIGTSTPSAMLSLGEWNSGNINSNKQLLISGEHNSGANIDGYKLVIEGYDNDGSTVYPIYLQDENGNIDFWLKNRPSINDYPTMYFAGNVGIGTSTPLEKLDVNGNAIADSWLTHSSQKWKKDITPLYDTLNKITQIQAVTYSWRADEFPEMSFDGTTTQIGLIAEDLEMIYPELVYTTDNGDKLIDYSKLTPILVQAIKEQQDRFDAKFTEQQDILEQLKTVICPQHQELSACQ